MVQVQVARWYRTFEQIHGVVERKRTVERRKLAGLYGIEAREIDLPRLLFAIETYYVLRMKLYAYAALTSKNANGAHGDASFAKKAAPPSSEPQTLLRMIFSPGFFERFGILNYDESGLFPWFIDYLGRIPSDTLGSETAHILEDGRTASELGVRDVLRPIYHELIPRQVRHAVGAFYTPEWLAQYMLTELGYEEGETPWTSRLLDPTCGSGTFVLAALRMSFAAATRSSFHPSDFLSKALSNFVGYDIDPVAILAAKTNFIILLTQMMDWGVQVPEEGVRLPFYLCDSIYSPLSTSEHQTSLLDDNPVASIRLDGQTVDIPRCLLNSEKWQRFVDSLADSIPEKTDSEHWLRGFDEADKPLDPVVRKSLVDLVQVLLQQDEAGQTSMSVQALRDALEPHTQASFDFVVGNPPWVNWEYLPSDYRDLIQDMWPQLGLFDLTGRDRAFSKEDVSALVTYVACDRYLRKGGKLSFVMPQSVLKSALNGRGFRRFRIGQHGEYLRVIKVEDLVDVSPFESVANRTAVLFMEKGSRTTYPVNYRVWKIKTARRNINEAAPWTSVKDHISFIEQKAMPSDGNSAESHWMTGPQEALNIIPRMSGPSAYRARTGVFTGGANGVFYLELLERLPGNLLRIRNITERTRRKVPEVEAVIEDRHVYPLLRGRDVGRWRAKTDAFILCPHTAETRMAPIPPSTLKAECPKTYTYLETFRGSLEERRGFVGWERKYFDEAFYAIQRIGDYTFSRYKVVWRYISQSFVCAVTGPLTTGGRHVSPILPHEKLMMLPFDDEDEAHYVCGVFSSSPVRFFVESRMVSTQIAPHVIKHLAVPRFDPTCSLHTRIAKLCRYGHMDMVQEDGRHCANVLADIDRCVKDLMDLSDAELKTSQAALDSSS